MSLASGHLQEETVSAVEANTRGFPDGGNVLGMNPDLVGVEDVSGDVFIRGTGQPEKCATNHFGVRHDWSLRGESIGRAPTASATQRGSRDERTAFRAERLTASAVPKRWSTLRPPAWFAAYAGHNDGRPKWC